MCQGLEIPRCQKQWRGDSPAAPGSLLQKPRVSGERPRRLWAQLVNAALWSPAPSVPFLLVLNGEQRAGATVPCA